MQKPSRVSGAAGKSPGIFASLDMLAILDATRFVVLMLAKRRMNEPVLPRWPDSRPSVREHTTRADFQFDNPRQMARRPIAASLCKRFRCDLQHARLRELSSGTDGREISRGRARELIRRWFPPRRSRALADDRT